MPKPLFLFRIVNATINIVYPTFHIIDPCPQGSQFLAKITKGDLHPLFDQCRKAVNILGERIDKLILLGKHHSTVDECYIHAVKFPTTEHIGKQPSAVHLLIFWQEKPSASARSFCFIPFIARNAFMLSPIFISYLRSFFCFHYTGLQDILQ